MFYYTILFSRQMQTSEIHFPFKSQIMEQNKDI